MQPQKEFLWLDLNEQNVKSELKSLLELTSYFTPTRPRYGLQSMWRIAYLGIKTTTIRITLQHTNLKATLHPTNPHTTLHSPNITST